MPPCLEEYSRRWLLRHAHRVSPPTLTRYTIYLRRHVLPLLGQDPLRAIRAGDVRALAETLLERGLAPGTIRAILQCLHALFQSAVEDGHLAGNPVVGLARRYRAGHGRALGRAQLAVFLRAAREVTPLYAPLFDLMARTGLRLGEALALQWADVDWTHGIVTVARQRTGNAVVPYTKSREERHVALTAGALDALRRLVRRDPAWLWPNPLRALPWHPGSAEAAFARAAKAAGLPAGHFTPHALRHTYATITLELTRDVRFVQQQLGHRSIRMTVDLYARRARNPRPAALDLLDDVAHGRLGCQGVPIDDAKRRAGGRGRA